MTDWFSQIIVTIRIEKLLLNSLTKFITVATMLEWVTISVVLVLCLKY